MKVELKQLNEAIKRASVYTVDGRYCPPKQTVLRIKTDSTYVCYNPTGNIKTSC